MLDTIKQWALVILSLLLAIPVAKWAYAGLDAPNGLPGAPIVLTESSWGAAIRVLIASIWFGVLALATGRFSHRYTGAFVYGLLWSAVAIYTAPIDALLRMMDEFDRSFAGTLILFAIETLYWAAPALLVIFLLARLTPNRYSDEESPLSATSLKALGAACVLGLVLCWLMIRTDLTKQAVGGMIAGMGIAVMATRLMWRHANGSLLFVAPVVVGVAGHIIGALIMGDDALRLSAAGRTWPLSRATPIDLIGPGIAGVSLGISLARSFGHEEEDARRETDHGASRASADGAAVTS